MNREQLLELPKIDLHCHLDGSLTRHSMEKLLGRRVEEEEIRVSDDCKSLAEYLEKFDLPLQCLQTAEGLEEASREFLVEASKDNLIYVEVRFAPLLSVNESLTCEQVIEAVLKGLKKGRELCGTDYNVIACAMRHHTRKQNLSMFHAAREFLGQGVCALDLAGNEAAFPMKDFKELFAEAAGLGFPFTLHAGECGSAQNIVDSVECGARRIGHGIAMSGQAEVMELCRRQQVGIEMCPISNLQTKAVTDKSRYPMREFLDAGLSVTINTDNRTVSHTSLTREMEFVQREYGISDEELLVMTRNAAECCFADEATKEKLFQKLK